MQTRDHRSSSLPARLTSRHLILVCILATTASAAYFHLVDRILFSSAGFAAIFKYLLLQYDARTAWVAVGICVVAAAWARPTPILVLIDGLGRHPRAVAVAGALLASIGSRVVYRHYPFSMDEYAAVFQSKVFAAGRLWAQLPPNAVDWFVVRGFNGSFLYASRETGQAVEAYWPGFALLLAPFQLFGVPWACNALLAAAAITLVFLITIEITKDRRAAGWAIGFTISSGAFWAYAISLYSMQAHLTANLFFAYLLLRPTRARALAAGLVGSLALNLHNPFPHAMFAAPWLISMALDRRQWANLGPLIVGYLPGLCVGMGWLLLRMEIVPTSVGVVGGVGHGVFTWPDAALFNVRTASVVKLWLWASPGLILFALLGVHRAVADRGVRLLALSAGLTFLGYCFVRFDQGHGWGYRYFHSAWGAIPILAGIGMAREKNSGLSRLIAFAGAAAILNLAVVVPLQMLQIEHVIAEHLSQLPPARRSGGNVFFIKPRAGFYLADMIQIDPWLRGPDLLLATRGDPLDAELMRQNWPDAHVVASGVWGRQWYVGVTGRPITWHEPSASDVP